MSSRTIKNKKRWIIVIILSVLSGFLIWGASWATYSRLPQPDALTALESDAIVQVSQEPWLTFSPQEGLPSAGLIFYPGGRIDPRGFAPIMHQISAQGYLVVVPTMPINMAIFDPDKADKIMDHYFEIDSWILGGHSVGGTAAALYSSRNPGKVQGLVIWASYPASNSDLSQIDIPVLMIYGELDPRVNQQSIEERKDLLPADTVYQEIKGGDHHQFGTYLTKPDENHATIARSVQQEQITQGTLELLNKAIEDN
jgi:pimeloyl-ACP methyl ester carboxylesterase